MTLPLTFLRPAASLVLATYLLLSGACAQNRTDATPTTPTTADRPDPILWWSPDPRFVLYPERLRVQKSMRPLLNRRAFRLSYDTAFERVIRVCARSPRGGQPVGTWISEPLIAGYVGLHEAGYAHSVEAWDADGRLVGGLYGVAVGRIFCGESMFAVAPNASKYAFIQFVRDLERRGYALIDCQIPTEHLARFGAEAISRREYTRALARYAAEGSDQGSWAGRALG